LALSPASQYRLYAITSLLPAATPLSGVQCRVSAVSVLDKSSVGGLIY